MDRMPPNPAACTGLLVLALAACGEGAGTDEATTVAVSPAPLQPVTLGETQATEYPRRVAPIRPAAQPQGRWFVEDDEGRPHAVWGAPHSEGTVFLGCDEDTGRIVVQREAIDVPATTTTMTLEADGVRVDYPADYAESTLGANLTTRIALDAPILDRMLTASRFTLLADRSALVTTSPAPALRPVVEACRARH